jgi:signal transduction histidine kinase
MATRDLDSLPEMKPLQGYDRSASSRSRVRSVLKPTYHCCRVQNLTQDVGTRIDSETDSPANTDEHVGTRVRQHSTTGTFNGSGSFNALQLSSNWTGYVVATATSVLILSTLWSFFLRRRIKTRTQQLAELSAYLRASYDSVREGILVVDSTGRVVNSNHKLTEWFNLPPEPRQTDVSEQEAFLDQIAHSLTSASTFRQFYQRILRDERCSQLIEISLHQPQHREIIVYTAPVIISDGAVGGRLWTFENVTDQRMLQRSLIQMQKLDAVGRLAAGVAHDFNNLLTVISGNLSLIRQTTDPDSDLTVQHLDAADLAVDRATRLIRNLLGFSRQMNLELRTGNVNQVVDNVLMWLKPSVNPGVTLNVSLQQDIWPCDFDATHLEQVLLNICLNARESLLDGSGTISIKTQNLRQQDHADTVVITVSDNGSGITERDQQRLFEPFFSTKSVDQGTGLGLAMSYGIIQEHGGRIDVDSAPGRGTTIRVSLPRHNPASSGTIPCHLSQSGARPGTILLAAGNSVVRDTTRMILQQIGYTVLVAGNEYEAVDALATNQDISTLILDLEMSRLPDIDMFVQIQKLRPSLPIIIITDSVTRFEDSALHVFRQRIHILPKSFNAGDLVDALEASRSFRSADQPVNVPTDDTTSH